LKFRLASLRKPISKEGPIVDSNKLTSLLKQLSAAPGVSGYEDAVRAIVLEEFGRYAEQVRTDVLGNVIALKRGAPGDNPKRSIMLAAHMDEIGLMVTDFDKGFLKFTTVGGIDPRVLLGQEVIVHGRSDLPGLIGNRPPHVLQADQYDKPIPIDELHIDLGLNEEEVREQVRVGDVVTIHRPVVALHNEHLTGKAMDDRAGLAVIAACLDHLVGQHHTWDVYAVGTVQEEFGLQGAITSAHGLAPDIAVAVDVTWGDGPDISDAEASELGKGPVLGLGPNVHPCLYELLLQTAKELEIPYQIEAIPGRSGTDAWAIQVAREGIPTAILMVPTRNLHSAVETVSLKDLQRAGRLLAAFIARLEESLLARLSWQDEKFPLEEEAPHD